MSLLDELLREFPDLEPQKKEIARIITAMEQGTSPPKLDDAFVQKLRNELMTKIPSQSPQSPYSSFFSFMQQKTFAIAGTILAIALLIPASYTLWKISTEGAGSTFSTSPETITMLDAQAFGSLSGATAAGVANGKGSGSGLSEASTSSMLTIDEKMFAPGEPYPYEPTVYIYSFAEDLAPYLADATGTVYERQAFSGFDGSTLNGIPNAFSHLNISAFLGGDLISFVLSANGYMLSVDTTGNMWSMYKDWTNYVWDESWTPLTAENLPSDDAIIATAKDFANTWGIDVNGYGEPMIAEPEIALARSGATDVYIPESATVVFPVLVDGQLVYPSWTSAPTGLRISINLRDMTVTNAYDALSQAYNASAYDLTQDTTLVGKLIAGGGSEPVTYEGMAINEVNVQLNAPERILMEYSLYENGQSRTLFIPALRFTMTDPSQIPWTSGVITVPLVKDIAEAQVIVNDDIRVFDGVSSEPMVK
jgi:hypothetical protein